VNGGSLVKPGRFVIVFVNRGTGAGVSTGTGFVDVTLWPRNPATVTTTTSVANASKLKVLFIGFSLSPFNPA